jgi:SAM-dependent methyltransferase
VKNQLSTFGRTLSRRLSLPRYYLKTHLTAFAQVIGPSSLTLDVGSSELHPYQSLFDSERYLGVDYFERADVKADASSLPFASGVVSVVLLTEVLEHLPHPAGALQEINRVLCNEGHLVITVPLIWGVHDHIDYQRWTEHGLVKILNEAGFEVLYLKRRGGVFSMIGCMVAQIPVQVFGEMKYQRHWWAIGAFVISWALLTPIPWLASLFDRLDHRQDFTLGYSVLCRKR